MMGLLKCKKCGAEISFSAQKCPECGVSSPAFGAKDFAILAAVVLGYWAWGSFSGADTPPKPAAAEVTRALKAEDIALTKPGSFMCLSQDWANQFFEHAIRGERTKMEQILGGGECSLVKDGMKVKVLAIRGSVSEVVRVDVDSAVPLWAATEFLQPE